MKNILMAAFVLLLVSISGTSKAYAGTLYPTAAPGETMYSLQEIYNLVTASTTVQEGNGSPIVTPSSVNPSGTMVTLTEIYESILSLMGLDDQVPPNDDGTDIEPDLHASLDLISATSTDNVGVYTFDLTLHALDEDVYIPADISTGTLLLNLGEVTNLNANTTVVSSSSVEAVGGYYKIASNTSETLQLEITVENLDTNPQNVSASIYSIAYLDGSLQSTVEELLVDYEEFSSITLTLAGAPVDSGDDNPGGVDEDVDLEVVMSSRDAVSADTVGTYTFDLTFTALDEDVYIPVDLDVSTLLLNDDVTTNTNASTSVVLSSGAGAVGGYYKIASNTSETFHIEFTVENLDSNPLDASAGIYAIQYKDNSVQNPLENLVVYYQDFFTNSVTLNGVSGGSTEDTGGDNGNGTGDSIDDEEDLQIILDNTTVNTQGNLGSYIFDFTVQALDEDVYIPVDVDVTKLLLNSEEVSYLNVGASAVLDSNVTAVNGYFKVAAGTSESFQLVLELENLDVNPQDIYASIYSIQYVDNSLENPTEEFVVNYEDFSTEAKTLDGNTSGTGDDTSDQNITDPEEDLTANLVSTVIFIREDDNAGVYKFNFDVQALDEDVYISPDVDLMETLLLNYSELSSISADVIAWITSNAEQVDGYYRVAAGTSESFTLEMDVQNTLDEDQNLYASVYSIWYKDGSTNTPTEIYRVNLGDFSSQQLILPALGSASI